MAAETLEQHNLTEEEVAALVSAGWTHVSAIGEAAIERVVHLFSRVTPEAAPAPASDAPQAA